jgi:hypothetical protein
LANLVPEAMRMKAPVIIALVALFLAGLEVLPQGSSPQSSGSPQLPTAQSVYGQATKPSSTTDYQGQSCGDPLGSYPVVQEKESVSHDALGDRPDLMNMAEVTRRLAPYDNQLLAWCIGLKRRYAPPEWERRVESAWHSAGGTGPAPAEVRLVPLDSLLKWKLEWYVGMHRKTLRVWMPFGSLPGRAEGYLVRQNGKVAEIAAGPLSGCGSLNLGPCGPSDVAFTVASVNAIDEGMKKLPAVDLIVSTWLDNYITDHVVERTLHYKWLQAFQSSGEETARPLEQAWRGFSNSHHVQDPSAPQAPDVLNQPLFNSAVYTVMPPGGKIFLYAVCADGLQAIDKLYVGVPTLVEVQLKTDYGKSEYQFELSAGGVPLKLNAHAIDQHGRIFRTDPFVPVPLKADIGPMFNPSNGPQR